jgi:collagen type III alpha
MPKSAAEATPPTGNRFVEFDEFIDYQLTKASKSIQSTDVLVGVVGAGLGLTLYVFIFILADHWLVTGGLGAWARVAYWGIGLGALGYWIATRVIKPLNGRVNSLYAARQIERTHPALKSSLLTLTDIKQAGRATSGQIRGSLEKRAAVGLSKADVEEAVDRSSLMTCSYALLFLLAVFCGYALLSPKSILQSAWRAFVPFTSTGVATRTRIDQVDPGNTEVPAMSHLDVTVEISGNAPPEATLYYTTADGAFVDEALPLRDTGEGLRRYRGTLIGPDGRGLRQNLTYHVVAGDARSDNYSVTVVESPSAVVDSVDYEYQAYTGLANKTEPGGAIDAWEGTRVTVHATANQKVKSATVLFSDTEDTSVKAEEQPMIITEGTKLKASWQLAFRSGGSFPKFYRVQVKTDDNHEDPLPTLHPLNIRADLPPKVEVLLPKSDIQSPVNGFVGIAYRASDPDFKLRSLVLNLEHEGQVLATSPRLFGGPPDEESRDGKHVLRLKDFNLKAGSRLTYWIEARDNFEPFGDRGVNRAVTPRLNIDLVEPQPPARAAEQEKKADNQAQEALQESRPEQGQPMGAENARDERPQADQKGSESKPENDSNQDGKPERRGEPNDQGNKGTERPGEQASPMPGDRSQGQPQDQKSAESEQQQQQGTGDKTGEKQSADQGKTGEKTAPGDSKPGAEQPPNQGNRNGEKGTPGSEHQQSKGQQSGPRDKAQDDTALEKILRHDQQQREREQQQQQKRSENADPSKPNEQRGTPGEKKSDDGRSPNNMNDPANPMKGQEKGAPGQSPEDRGSPKDNNQSNDDAGKTGETKQPGEKPAGDPMQNQSGTGEKPGALDQKSPMPGEKGGNEESPAKAQEKEKQPGPTDDASKVNKAGDETGEASDSKQPGQPGAKPDSAKKPGQPGDPKADQTENSAQPPMDKQGTPGEKSPSPQTQDQKPGATGSQTKGTETPTGESGDRTQPKDQKPGTQETSGNSTQSPAGQSDDQGTRQKGSGDPGSSTPGEGSGQKSPGKGEPGKGGEKSSTGEKSGAAKSNDGKTSQPGSKPGEPSSGDQSEKPGAQQEKNSEPKPGEQNPDGSPKDGSEQSQDGKAGSEKGGDPKGGEQKGGGEKGGDQKGGGEKGGDQKGGGEKGGDQKGGGQKGGGEKGGDPGSSGQQPGAGQGNDGKPSQAGAKPGMGGAGGSGSGAASAEGAHGEGSPGAFKPDAPNLENMKKATNLALKRLQESLDRREIDPELQKELGFTEEEMQQFIDRLQQRLADNGDDNSPEAQARRRQFEQLLKGINLQTETGKREAGTGTGPAGTGFGAGKRSVPAEYRAAEPRYRELLNKKK